MAARLTADQVRRATDWLFALRADPAAQAEAAIDLLALPPGPAVLFPVAEVLARNPLPAAREGLLAAFAAVDADRKRLDPGGALRTALLQALRPVATAADLPLFLQAASTYEVTFNGPAALELRAAAAVALAGLAPDVAAFVAARLLAEAGDADRTSMLGGEPALTAARVLGALGRYEPLYLAAMLPWAAPSEVVAECIRQLAPAGFPAFLPLVERHGHAPAVVQAAIVDLLIGGGPPGPAGEPALIAWLRAVPADVYEFAVASLVASRSAAHHALAAALVAGEYRRDRLAIAAAALANARGSPPLLAAQAAVQARLDPAPE